MEAGCVCLKFISWGRERRFYFVETYLILMGGKGRGRKGREREGISLFD